MVLIYFKAYTWQKRYVHDRRRQSQEHPMDMFYMIVQHVLTIVSAIGSSRCFYDRPFRSYLWTQLFVVTLILRFFWKLPQGYTNAYRFFIPSVLYYLFYCFVFSYAVKKWGTSFITRGVRGISGTVHRLWNRRKTNGVR